MMDRPLPWCDDCYGTGRVITVASNGWWNTWMDYECPCVERWHAAWAYQDALDVAARADLRCTRPGCDRRDLHAHPLAGLV